jgi:hypothetical protein
MKKLMDIALALVMTLAICGTANAWFIDFEHALGQDNTPIGGSIPGLKFSTTDGVDWIYGDATSGNWNVSNDLGDSWLLGTYNIEGYCFASTYGSFGSGRIDFLNRDASWFSTGYTSYSQLYLEAYDEFDNLIDSDSGPANTQDQAGYALDYLGVSSAGNDIAYVLIHDSANFWLADNMSGDASDVPNGDAIPEPATLLLLGAGLLGGGIVRKRAHK